ncbi:hypothetical protein Glove_349g76 [Diversispora epigaea]|uniref:Uncharacterized protein n=1 Tax=Diversispora epigaea TaxID=1348612 RepID=A0A397HDK8_9GLOM|nr:hypothetical protein Glove_349g76 [Diversispora epigaea]
MSDIHVILSIDFGTTYSSFSYAHVSNNAIITNDTWPGFHGKLRTNTVLLYDPDFNVVAWGSQALNTRPKFKKSKLKSVELFKLHLSDIPESQKPMLPSGLDFKKAIADYLREIG